MNLKQCCGSGSICFGPPGSDPLVQGSDPAPDPFIIKQKLEENLDSYCLARGKKLRHFFAILKVTDENNRIRIPGSLSQRYGSADPDPYQNVMDPQHCRKVVNCDKKLLQNIHT